METTLSAGLRAVEYWLGQMRDPALSPQDLADYAKFCGTLIDRTLASLGDYVFIGANPEKTCHADVRYRLREVRSTLAEIHGIADHPDLYASGIVGRMIDAAQWSVDRTKEALLRADAHEFPQVVT